MTATVMNKDPTGWFMTEKFDGMRLLWDGKQLYTRQGTKVKAPTFFTSKLPKVPLDGEIW
jgi:DNA ligase-1